MDVKVHGNDIDKALRALKRQLQREGLFQEIKKRRFYEKPSEKKKQKKRRARKKGHGNTEVDYNVNTKKEISVAIPIITTFISSKVGANISGFWNPFYK